MMRRRESTASRVRGREVLEEWKRRFQYPGVDDEAAVMRFGGEEDER